MKLPHPRRHRRCRKWIERRRVCVGRPRGVSPFPSGQPFRPVLARCRIGLEKERDEWWVMSQPHHERVQHLTPHRHGHDPCHDHDRDHQDKDRYRRPGAHSMHAWYPCMLGTPCPRTLCPGGCRVRTILAGNRVRECANQPTNQPTYLLPNLIFNIASTTTPARMPPRGPRANPNAHAAHGLPQH